MMRLLPALLLLALCAACAGRPATRAATDTPPAMMLGTFVDDYGSRYSISASEWIQLPRGRHRIVRWSTTGRYLIAQNDSANASAGGKWTRIDWVPLAGMPPYTWAFCYSAYEAQSAAVAESTQVARPAMPRTGCNGFPFSRMAPIAR